MARLRRAVGAPVKGRPEEAGDQIDKGARLRISRAAYHFCALLSDALGMPCVAGDGPTLVCDNDPMPLLGSWQHDDLVIAPEFRWDVGRPWSPCSAVTEREAMGAWLRQHLTVTTELTDQRRFAQALFSMVWGRPSEKPGSATEPRIWKVLDDSFRHKMQPKNGASSAFYADGRPTPFTLFMQALRIDAHCMQQHVGTINTHLEDEMLSDSMRPSASALPLQADIYERVRIARDAFRSIGSSKDRLAGGAQRMVRCSINADDPGSFLLHDLPRAAASWKWSDVPKFIRTQDQPADVFCVASTEEVEHSSDATDDVAIRMRAGGDSPLWGAWEHDVDPDSDVLLSAELLFGSPSVENEAPLAIIIEMRIFK